MALALLGALGLLLVWAGIEDARVRTIANWKNAAIALMAPLWWWTTRLSPWPDIAWQVGIALAIFAMFCAAFHFGMMGGGDVKLIGALALWLPAAPLMGMLLVMSIVGGVVTLVMLIGSKFYKNGGPSRFPMVSQSPSRVCFRSANHFLTKYRECLRPDQPVRAARKA